MPGPKSIDLRESVVTAYERGEGSYPVIARIFGIGVATAGRWCRAYKATGRIAPLPMGGSRGRRKIDDAGVEVLAEVVEEKRDRTTQEIADAYEERTGVHIHRGTISRELKAHGLKRKKRLSKRRSARQSG